MVTGKQRSRFGDLIVKYREQLGLSQEALAERTLMSTTDQSRAVDGVSISVSTIQNWERKRPIGQPFIKPFLTSVKSLANAFSLVEGSDEYEYFLHASRDETNLEDTEIPSTAWAEQDLFIDAGRIQHLSRLESVLTQLLAWQPDFAIVGAVGGTGKSSLIAEVCRRALDDRTEPMTVIWTECTELERSQNTSAPLRQIVELALGMTNHLSPRVLVSHDNRHRLRTQSKVAIDAVVIHAPGLIGRVLSVDAILARALEANAGQESLRYLRRILSQSVELQVGSSGLNEDVVRLLIEYSRKYPVLLVIENLHWASERTSYLLAELARRLHRLPARIGIIGSYRTEQLRDSFGSVPFQPVLREIEHSYPAANVDLNSAVNEVNGHAFVTEYLAAHMSYVPSSFLNEMLKKTSGSPMAVRALMDSFAQQGVFEEDSSGKLKLVSSPDWWAISSDFRAVYSDRIDRTSAPEQALLECAAVAGVGFYAEVVERAIESSGSQFQHMLSSQLARHHRLVYEEGPITIVNKRVHMFRFQHELLRDVMVSRIGSFDRQRYHLSIASAMGGVFGLGANDMASAIAWHYEQGGDLNAAGLSYKSAGDHALQTDQFHMASGDFALEMEAFQGAIWYFNQARDYIDGDSHPEIRAGVVLGLANCARANKERKEARQLASEALSLCQEHGLKVLASHCMFTLAMIEYDAGEMRQALEKLEAAKLTLSDNAENADRGRVEALLSHVYFGLGNIDLAALAAREASKMAEKAGDQTLELEALLGEANCLIEVGQFELSRAAYEKMLTITRSMQKPRSTCLAHVNLALGCVEERLWGPALAHLELVNAILSATFVPRIEGFCSYYRALIEEGRENFEAAYDWFLRALRAREEAGQVALEMDAVAGQLRVALALSKREQVEDLLHDLKARIEHRGVIGVEHPGRLYLALIRAHWYLGNQQEAVVACLEASDFLTARVGAIAHEDYRESFLNNISSHRELQDWIARILNSRGLPC